MWPYRPELEGLRTFAVVVIVFFHAGMAGWQNSFIALGLFVVLSGFLVINVVPLLDQVVVWRNANLLTTDIAIHLRESIWNLLLDTGLVE